MAKYALSYNKTGADSVLEHVEVLADATRPRRGKLYDLVVSCTTTPADALFQYMVKRVTGSATGTALTPNPLDPADAATETDSKHLITADAASYAAGTELLRMPVNHRATFRWVAAPGGELVWPATASNGLGIGVAAASTNTFSGTAHFEEQ